jgi:hypothetical protein
MLIGRRSLPLTDRPHPEKREVRNFGLLFAAIGLLTGAYMVWKGKGGAWVAFSLAGVFLLTGLFMPSVLTPCYRAWMRFAALLAWINTRVLLTVFFFVVVTPIGVVMRWFGKDLLNQKLDRSAQTYWVRREQVEKDKKSYEHLF